MDIAALLKDPVGVDRLRSTTPRGVFDELSMALISAGFLSEAGGKTLAAALMAREATGSTAFGFGFAIPHAVCNELDRIRIVVGRHPGLDMGAVDGDPTTVLVAIVGPESERETYLAVLRSVAGILRDRQWRRFIHQAGSAQGIVEVLVEAATH